jgi:hypothetical protein
MPIPLYPRSPRARAPALIRRRHLNYLRIHPLYLITPRAPNVHSPRPVPPCIILTIPPLPGNPPLLKFLILCLTLFLESPPSSATRAATPRPRAPDITETARSQGAEIPFPTTTLVPLLHPTPRNPNSLLPRPPFSTMTRRVSLELSPV